MQTFIKKFFSETRSFFLPHVCLLCRLEATQYGICEGCEKDLPWQKTCCTCCAEPMEVSQMCGRCLQQKPYYDQIITPFRYDAHIKHLVTQFKFHEKLCCANLFAMQMLSYLSQQSKVERPDLIIPVPLHPKRIRERGFNQALEIAKILSKEWRLPLSRHMLKKIRSTMPQSAQGYKARKNNIHHAFALACSVQDQHVAVIDDVVTTGSTVNEIAKVLKFAGAKRVTVLAVARTQAH